MIESYKKIDFSCLDKAFLNNDSVVYYVSNLGNIKKNNKPMNLTKKSDKRLIFRLDLNKKRYEIGVASLVAIYFLDKKFSTYDIKFKDNNPLNCNLNNIELVYRHAYRKKSKKLVDMFNDYMYSNKSKRIFFEMISRKDLIFKPYFDYEDLFQEFSLYIYERLNNFKIKKHLNLTRFCLSNFNTWYGKYIRSKIVKERFTYDLLDNYQNKEDSYNLVNQYN